MRAVNEVTIIGHVGQNAKIIQGDFGSMATFSVATTDSWLDKNTNEVKELTEWHNVRVKNEKIIPFIEKEIKKGSHVYVRGALRTRLYTLKDGVEKKITEIVVEGFQGKIEVFNKMPVVPEPDKNFHSDDYIPY